jgi:hypothetical protein
MSSRPATLRVPTTTEISEIAAVRDPVIRNLRITDCYYRISVAMRTRIGDCANWCTFATWASRQAGCTIRGEDFFDRLAERVLPHWTPTHPIRSTWRALLRRGLFHAETRLGRLVQTIHSPFDAFERASHAVATGNLKVFEEIGFEMARYLESCPAGCSTDSREFRAFVDVLKPGTPPDGQDYLRRAFTRYQLMQSAVSMEHRLQLGLLANLEIGFHEQTRLQPEILRAMEAIPETAEDLKRRILLMVTSPYRRFARALTRQVISERMMVLRLPATTLELGRHLDRPVPECYRKIDLTELNAILEPFEQGCSDCGARDWSELQQRMHYILHLFRAFALQGDLFDPPFTAAQIQEIFRGRIPQGKLV